MHEFSRGPGHAHPENFLSLESLKCHFPDFGVRFYRILMVRKRHCDISEAQAIVFALQPEPGGPIWPIAGLEAPEFARSEPIVVTPLHAMYYVAFVYCEVERSRDYFPVH